MQKVEGEDIETIHVVAGGKKARWSAVAFKETTLHVASGKESLKGECEGLKTMHVQKERKANNM